MALCSRCRVNDECPQEIRDTMTSAQFFKCMKDSQLVDEQGLLNKVSSSSECIVVCCVLLCEADDLNGIDTSLMSGEVRLNIHNSTR